MVGHPRNGGGTLGRAAYLTLTKPEPWIAQPTYKVPCPQVFDAIVARPEPRRLTRRSQARIR